MKSKLHRSLVTGATGFVGSRLVQRLLSDECDVSIVVRPTSNLSQLEDVKGHIKIYKHNGSTKRLIDVIATANPDIVFHLASNCTIHHKSTDIVPLISSNIQFGTQLVESMIHNGVCNLINTGTSWQHYMNYDYSPVCLYAATKQAFETILKYYIETSSLRVITLKLFDTYGPDDPRPKLFQLLKNSANQKEPLAMSPGDQMIDLVYIDDVIEAYLVAAERLQAEQDIAHEQYAVSSGRPISLKKLVSIYEQVTQITPNIEWGGRPYRRREVMVPWNQGRQLSGWKPQVDLTEGIGRTYGYKVNLCKS